jgi:hypothetical protein
MGSQEWAGSKKQRREGGNLMGAANGGCRLPLAGQADTVLRIRTFKFIDGVPLARLKAHGGLLYPEKEGTNAKV